MDSGAIDEINKNSPYKNKIVKGASEWTVRERMKGWVLNCEVGNLSCSAVGLRDLLEFLAKLSDQLNILNHILKVTEPLEQNLLWFSSIKYLWKIIWWIYVIEILYDKEFTLINIEF